MGQMGRRDVEDLAHHLEPLAHSEAANGVAVKADLDQAFRAFPAQILIGAALDNAEQRLA